MQHNTALMRQRGAKSGDVTSRRLVSSTSRPLLVHCVVCPLLVDQGARPANASNPHPKPKSQAPCCFLPFLFLMRCVQGGNEHIPRSFSPAQPSREPPSRSSHRRPSTQSSASHPSHPSSSSIPPSAPRLPTSRHALPGSVCLGRQPLPLSADRLIGVVGRELPQTNLPMYDIPKPSISPVTSRDADPFEWVGYTPRYIAFRAGRCCCCCCCATTGATAARKRPRPVPMGRASLLMSDV
ncbi:hypothetical protein HDK77DRAFT_135146 [Phyllosticta capitalensis]